VHDGTPLNTFVTSQKLFITGRVTGQNVFIQRILIIPSECPFTLKRIQFLVRLCFTVNIHKSQGQSLKMFGLNL